MMNQKTGEMKLPSLLSFERKLEISDALMCAGVWSDMDNKNAWQPIPITKRQNRATQSAYEISDDNKTKPNPVSSGSDDANLPQDKDTLKVSFTLRVIGNLGVPFACNEPKFTSAIRDKVNEFKENGLATLAYRYAYNIANGRFLWRNRVCAENVRVDVNYEDLKTPLVFNAYDFDLNNFERNKENDSLKKLTSKIKSGLEGENQFVFLGVTAYVKLGKGQHVFPSQEMNMKEKGKVLFKLNGCAAIHNVKLGNASRTIDNWYYNAGFPIAVEPYGSVTQQGQAYRKRKNDLYSLMIKWVNEKEKISMDDKNYIVANLIRGGVFSGEPKK